MLDISANNFSEESYETLKTGFFKNISLSKLDIRQNKFKNRKITFIYKNSHFNIKYQNIIFYNNFCEFFRKQLNMREN